MKVEKLKRGDLLFDKTDCSIVQYRGQPSFIKDGMHLIEKGSHIHMDMGEISDKDLKSYFMFIARPEELT